MASVRAIAPHLRALNAPEPIRALPGWLLWRYETCENEPKPRKVPYYASGKRRYGQQGSPSDRTQLTTFGAARDAAVRGGYDGVGLALLPDWQLTALDVDHCVDADGNIPPEILDIVRHTYGEYSPSGNGVRAFFFGNVGNHKSTATSEQYGLETFNSTGFVTFTGNILPHVDLLGYEDRVAQVPDSLVALCESRFGSVTGTFDPDDFMAGHEPKLGLTVEQMEDLLAALDPDMPREPWLRVGLALHHETEGDDTGFELWDEWSSGGATYPGTEGLRHQWDSFKGPTPGRRQTTMASVIKMAKQAGLDTRPLKATTADELRRVVAESADDLPVSVNGATPPGYAGKFPMYRASEIAARPPGRWWIKGLVPEAQIGAVFGASGSGKSFIVLDLIAHLALGWAWRELRTRRGRILYVAAEGGAGVGKRLKAWCQHHDVPVDALDVTVLLVAPNIMQRDDITELVLAINAAGGFEHIVLDTYAQVTPGANENTAEDMGLALAHCRAICEATAAMVWLVHHSGKDATKGARGWSGINAALDFSLEVTRDEDTGYRELRVAKMKDGEDGTRYGFKLETVVVGFDDDLDEVTSCVVIDAEAPAKPETASKGVKRRGRVENHVLEVMTLFEGRDTVRIEDLVQKAVETMPVPEAGKRDTRKQGVVRALHNLSREKDGPLQVKGGLVIFYE